MPEPTVADWVIAGAEIVAAAGTIGALIYVAKSFRLDSEQRRSDMEQRRRSQAGMIYALPTTFVPLKATDDGTMMIYDEFEIDVHNGSHQPIYEVEVFVHHYDWKTNPNRGHSQTNYLTMIPPGRSGRATIGIGIEAFKIEGMDRPYSQQIVVIFTDNSGRHWRRDPDGTLTELSERTFWEPFPPVQRPVVTDDPHEPTE